MNLAMTGQGAFFDVMSKGALLAAEQVGAAGGPTINITINDHQSGEVPPSVNGVRKLISQEDLVPADILRRSLRGADSLSCSRTRSSPSMAAEPVRSSSLRTTSG